MTIHTVCKYGECLSPEVLDGVVKNNCHLMVISSCSDNDKKDRKNICRNWRTAMAYCNEDVFIGMDSDIVLAENNVLELVKNITDNNIDFAWIAVNPGNSHGIWAVSKKIIDKVPFEIIENDCPICNWRIKINELGYNTMRVCDVQVKHINRLTIKGGHYGRTETERKRNTADETGGI